MGPHKKEIVFILPDFNGGGAQRVLIRYANNLNFDKLDVTIIAVQDSGPLKHIVREHVNIINLGQNSVMSSLPQMLKALNKLKPDVIISTMSYVNFGVLLLRPFFPRTCFIVREANMTEAVFKGVSKVKNLVFKCMYFFLYPLASYVIAPASIIMQDISKYSIIPRAKQKIIYNPVDIHNLPAKDETNDFIEKNEVHFVAAGRLHWQKGFDRLIEALGENPPKHNWVLKILGEGKDLNKLRHKISQYDLEEHIKLIGFQDNPWVHYSQADYFLLPSRTEGLPNVVLESLACGTPVIAMKEAGGIGEIAEQCQVDAVQIFDTIEAFVMEMHRLCEHGIDKDIDTSLPEVFSLNYAVHSLESLFTDELTNAGLAKKKIKGKNKA